MSRALEVPADPHVVHEDWLVWRRILEQGWRARKQRATYGYRRHAGGVSVAKQSERPYFDLRGLAHETITLFVPLSGRTAIWPRFQQFLEQQTWPHDQVRLVLLDTSQYARFGRRVRRWISQCDYRDVRYFAEPVAKPGLADADRRLPEVQDAVRMAAARIYNLAACEVTGTFLWIVEDDVIPPNDAAALLLNGVDHNTASVAGPYPSRFHEGYVAWTAGRQIIRERDEEACRNSPHWLVQHGWDIAERFTQAAFLAHGVGVERDGFRYADRLKRKVDCNAVYKLLDQGLWWKLLEGKRLAIVGGHADELAKRLMDAEFVKGTGGDEVTWSVPVTRSCPGKSVTKLDTWKQVNGDLFAAEWDLLLCSAGSLSAVLCQAAQKRERWAIDIGAIDRVLEGIRHSRI